MLMAPRQCFSNLFSDPSWNFTTSNVKICKTGEMYTGIPTVVQCVSNPVYLCAGTGSIPAWHSWLRISCWCSCGIVCSSSSDLIPGLQTSICNGQKRKKKKSTTRNVDWDIAYEAVIEKISSHFSFNPQYNPMSHPNFRNGASGAKRS